MQILVINSGSSSVKFSVFTGGGDEPRALMDGEITGAGSHDARLVVGKSAAAVDAKTPEQIVRVLIDAVSKAQCGSVDAVGYRVVHPGQKLDRHQRITAEVLKDLDEAAVFAPLHDPVVMVLIRALMKQMPAVPHFACFDTIFHETMPVEATTYPLPKRFRDAGVKRYGFHGLSCESIVRRMRRETGGFPGRAAIAHLGSGCSVTALVDGRSVDTTMGLTPDGGVVMGTRPGDLDPGLLLYLLRQCKSIDEVETMLNRDAGMVALSGLKNDMKAVREEAAVGNEDALLALKVFTRSVRKAIGGYAWLLGGLDAVIFSGGIGEHDQATRAEVLGGLQGFGIEVKEEDAGKGLQRLSDGNSTVAVWVVPAEENLMIALHVQQMMAQGS